MAPYTQALFTVICIVAVAESTPQFKPISEASNAYNSIVHDLTRRSVDVQSTTRAPAAMALDRQPNGDLGFTMTGSAARPPPGSIHTEKPRPSINDVISALQNLSEHLPKQPDDKLPEPSTETITTEGVKYPPPRPINPTYPQPPVDPTPQLPVRPTYPQEPVEPTAQYPVYPTAQEPVRPNYPQPPSYNPTADGDHGVYPTREPVMTNLPIDESKTNQSIIILNLSDMQGAQYGGINLMQLLNTLNGKPGFVYVMQTGGQGLFVPLNQLQLLPQNGVPSYVVLLTHGRPNLVQNPGLQLINGMFSNGNLGFHIPNFSSMGSMPIYVVNGYYPIWSILSTLGIYHPDQNGNYLPHNDPTPYPGLVNPTPYPGLINPTPYPGLINFNDLTTPGPSIKATTQIPVLIPTLRPSKTKPILNIDLVTLMQILNQRPNGGGINIDKDNDDEPDEADSELIKILLQVLNEKPGSETEHVIIKEKKNPTNLLHILIELLSKKLGSEHVVVSSKKENNPSKLLQVLIELLRQKKGSSSVVISHNQDDSEAKLIQLLIKIIGQKQNTSQVVVSHNKDKNQSNLMKVLIQILGSQPEVSHVLTSGQTFNDPSQLMQLLIQILRKNSDASQILISGNRNNPSNVQKLYNILLQMIMTQQPNSGNNLSGSVVHLNDQSGHSGFNNGVNLDGLIQLVQILLSEQPSEPTIMLRDRRPVNGQYISGNDGINPKIMTMLMQSGGGSSNTKSALWSYLIGHMSCLHHDRRAVLCAK